MVITCQTGPVALATTYRTGFCVDERKCTNIQIKEAQDYTVAEEIPLMAPAASTTLLRLGRLAILKGC